MIHINCALQSFAGDNGRYILDKKIQDKKVHHVQHNIMQHIPGAIYKVIKLEVAWD